MKTLLSAMILISASVACSGSGQADASAAASDTAATATAAGNHQSPLFDGDSAYSFVAAQTAFGPRVPGTPPHKACAAYLAGKLSSYGVDVSPRTATVTDITGRRFDIINIFGRINPGAARRILLVAHWDTRPWADEDPDPSNHSRAIDGANDGASGVAVILEAARQMQSRAPEVGIDILLTDAEDSGKSAPEGADPSQILAYENSWCLGTQHWLATDPYRDNASPAFAILLDMVGGVDAVFPVEYFSHRYARPYVDKVLRAAAMAGTSRRFPDTPGGAINDDHVHLNRAGIPAVDIIETTGTGFNPTWHTMADNIDNIDRATLADVGLTLMTLIYNEKAH